ncbi:MAG: ATP-binding protein [Coprobacillus sp.]|nr:ATP-binding protein [Coprobacillus sp.]
MKRILKINNFRNIGVDNNFELILNPNYEQEKGGLVILIGHNNVGKSNVLDAIKSLKNDNETKLNWNDDSPFFEDSPDIVPSISIECIEDKKLVSEYNVSVSKIDKNPIQKYNLSEQNETLDDNDLKLIDDLVNIFSGLLDSGGNFNPRVGNPINMALSEELRKPQHEDTRSFLNKFQKADDKSTIITYKPINELYEIATSKRLPYNPSQQETLNSIKNSDLLNKLKKDYSLTNLERTEKKIGSSVKPNIIDATMASDGKRIFKYSNKDLVMTFNRYKPPSIPSDFFLNLLSVINYDYKKILTCYERAEQHNTPAKLNDAANDINKQIKNSVGKWMNRFFPSEGKNEYIINIELNPDSISLSVSTAKIGTIDLNQTSSGFRWMFDFFFTFYPSNTNLKPGDIIVIDDPCVYLHDSAINEFRDYLRNFALSYHITIIVATHRPAFIDVDNLEEVRIIKKPEKEIIVQNIFSDISCTRESIDNDFLSFITDALSTTRNVLLDEPGKLVVFVEGPTDYYYLTAYKQYLISQKLASDEDKNIVFLPLGGVSETARIVENIKKLDKVPFFLVDNDGGGTSFYKANEKDKSIVLLRFDQIITDKKVCGVESLFTEDEVHRYHLNEKTFCVSLKVKTEIKNGKLNQQTYDYFKMVFDKIKSINKSLIVEVKYNK